MTFQTYFTTFQTAAPRRITNKISQVVEFQLLGLFLSSKLSTFCQRSCTVNAVTRWCMVSKIMISGPPRRCLSASKASMK